MGLMRFQVSPPDRLNEDLLQQAYLTGLDRIPWRVNVSREGDILALERDVSESANLHVPWSIDGHGQLLVSTGSLLENRPIYRLPLELARGKIGQVRTQLGDWQGIGLATPEMVTSRLREAMDAFRLAAVHPEEPSGAELANQSLRLALDAAELLVMAYNEQAIGAYRRRVSSRLPTWLGVNLGASMPDEYQAKEILQAFNGAGVSVRWRDIETSEGQYSWDLFDRQIEWCRANQLTVCAGPLVQLDHRSVPDWIFLWEDDFDAIVACCTEFVRAAVERYRGQVALWVGAARLNSAEAMSFSEEERLRLAAWVVETIRRTDPETPAILSFDQPWAEYLSRADNDFSPIHFADALLRAGVGLTGLMLELNMGYHPGGTLPRDSLELSRLLDYWNLLNVPLYVALGIPSAATPDPLAQRSTRLTPSFWNPKIQHAWVSRFVPTMLAKRYVQGILWSQLRDCEPHDFPHAGLFDLRRHPKPALRALSSLRQAHLR